MTADAANRSTQGDAPFEAVDSKLTIYALANGMDLEKREASRRLAWFREGLDRGILVEVGADRSFSVSALAWRSRDASSERKAPVAERIDAAELPTRLSGLLDQATEIANGL